MQSHKPNRKMNKADMVYEILREGIINGQWRPGDRLYDNELAEQFGTSRNSVRQALSNLVESRLVEKGHWNGYWVRTPKWEEMAEAIDLRESLEFYVFQKLEKFPEDEFQEVLKLLEEQLNATKEALKSKHQVSLTIDMGFHEILYNAVAPYWLVDIMEELHAITDLQLNAHFKLFPEVSSISYKQHYGIFEKLKERDFEGIKPLLLEHLESYKKRAHEAYLRSLELKEKEDK